MSSLPPDYLAALSLLAKASSRYQQATGRLMVIVGGAAVSFYTVGAVLSGDFDMVVDTGFEPFLLEQGFIKEDRPNKLRRGYYHPSVIRLGFEFVSGALFDGKADHGRLVAVAIDKDEDEVVHFPAIEDLIADRLGQYASSRNRDAEMLGQAMALKSLADSLDHDYLVRRIREETGDPKAIGIDDA